MAFGCGGDGKRNIQSRKVPNMDSSHELMRLVCKQIGVKPVASALGVTRGTVDRWCRPLPPHGTGARSPADVIVRLLQITGDVRLLEWLCKQAGGRFVQGNKLGLIARKEWEQMKAEIDALFNAGNKPLAVAEKLGEERPCRWWLPGGRCGWRRSPAPARTIKSTGA
jgi:hypothetical protein